jgi:hypothetical protein
MPRRTHSVAVALLSLLLLSCSLPGYSQESRGNEHQKAPAEQAGTTKQIQQQRPAASRQSEDDALVEAISSIREQIKANADQHRTDSESWDSPSVCISIGLLIVGTLYTMFAFWQWRAICRQARIASDAQRPWVVVTRVDLPQLSKVPRVDREVSLDLKNTGSTPALRMAIQGRYSTSDAGSDPPEKNITYASSDKLTAPISLIGPGLTQTASRHIPVRALQHMMEDGGDLWIYGRIEYRGVLSRKKPYVTTFCFRCRQGCAQQEGAYNDCS